jgi:hypothetical protein
VATLEWARRQGETDKGLGMTAWGRLGVALGAVGMTAATAFGAGSAAHAASILPPPALGPMATATFTSGGYQFTVTVQGDPVGNARVYVTYNGPYAYECTGNTPAPGTTAPDPTVSKLTLPQVTVECANIHDTGDIHTISFAMNWTDFGTLGVAAGTGFVGLSRPAIATMTGSVSTALGFPFGNGSQTSAASMGLGLTP